MERSFLGPLCAAGAVPFSTRPFISGAFLHYKIEMLTGKVSVHNECTQQIGGHCLALPLAGAFPMPGDYTAAGSGNRSLRERALGCPFDR